MIRYAIPLAALLAVAAPNASAAPLELPYAGRLTDASGTPVAGPVDLEIAFFRSGDPADTTTLKTIAQPGVALRDGLFQVVLRPTDAELTAIFPEPRTPAYIQVRDVTHDRTYPRQSFSAVPYALKVPVDGTTLGYDASGNLQVNSTPKLQNRAVSANAPAPGDFLKWNAGSATWEPGGVAGASGGTVTGITAGAGLTATGTPITTTGTISIAAGGVDNAMLAANAVKTANIEDGAVTDAKLAAIASAGKVADTALSALVTKLGPDIDLSTAEVTGTLPVARGGIGAATAGANLVFAGPASGGAAAPGFRALVAADIAGLESDPEIGANTTSYVPRWNGSALVAGTLYDNGTQLAIGTTSPTAPLSINGDVHLNYNIIDFGGLAADHYYKAWVTTNHLNLSGYTGLIFHNYAGEFARLNATGLGIGTNAPGDLIDAQRSANGGARVRVTNTNTDAGAYAGFIGLSDSANVNLNAFSSTYAAPYAGNGMLYTGTGQDLLLGTDGQWRGVVKATTGNVGIGTTSPGQKLTVVGTIESTAGGVKFPDATTQTTAAFNAQIAQVSAGGRLTLTTGTPVTTTNVTAAGTLYYTPHTSSVIGLYTGTAWVIRNFNELAVSLASILSGSNYDVFVYDNAGTPALELGPAWTNDTTRATALARQDGVWVKSGATTRRYVGTIRGAAAGQAEDSTAKRFVWNYYNRVSKPLSAIDTTSQWTYSTNAWRQARGSAANQVELVRGLDEEPVTASVRCYGWVASGGAQYVGVGVGVDSTTANSSVVQGEWSDPAGRMYSAQYEGFPGVGRHYLAWLEISQANYTSYFQGQQASASWVQSGLTASGRF